MGKLNFTQISLNSQFESLNCFRNINDIFTDTLLVEILQRLTCIDVVRSKLVCRRWKSVILETYFAPTFIRYHDQLSTRFPMPVTLVYQFIFWHRVVTDEPESRVVSFSDNPFFKTRKFNLGFLPCFRSWARHPIWVTASNKDLLVCYDTKKSTQSSYYICNPLTKHLVVVPPISGQTRVADTAMGLVVSETGMFRLVRILELDSDDRFEAEVFCSEKSEWTKTSITSPISFRRSWHFKPEATVINNKLHWLINSEIIVVLDPFDDKELLCRVINLPSEINSQTAICIGSSRGCLKLSQLTGGYPNGNLVIWSFRDIVTKNWELECKISLRDVGFVDNLYFENYVCHMVEVLGFHPCDSMILYLRIRNYLVVCNLGCRTLEVASECLEDSTFSLGTCGVFPLVHPSWPSSLVSSRS
ncbi:hypothetical protein RND81_12G095400 [Saponaria officinalis]|uniref:F-box domain-containing protein n=1 Tax=Saponaria officinalis TaxID=3572 RepID=A0AAW1H8H5_SAPOF